MFDGIASTYDLLNRLLSLGIDKRWRRRILEHLPPKDQLRLLDMATGTGDLLIALSRDPRVKEAVGADLSKQMLARCEKKIEKTILREKKKIQLRVEDMENLSFRPNSFDVVTIAFGIRNVENPLRALKENHKALSKKGRLIILELSIPSHFVIKYLYLLYFRYLLPFVGGLISGNFKAYSYLNQTVEEFPQGMDFCELLKKAGFSSRKYETMTMGIVTLYVAEK